MGKKKDKNPRVGRMGPATTGKPATDSRAKGSLRLKGSVSASRKPKPSATVNQTTMQPPKTSRRVEAKFMTNEEIAKKLGRPAARRTGHAPKRGKLNLKAKQKSMH
jgi:hypothetical protein